MRNVEQRVLKNARNMDVTQVRSSLAQLKLGLCVETKTKERRKEKNANVVITGSGFFALEVNNYLRKS